MSGLLLELLVGCAVWVKLNDHTHTQPRTHTQAPTPSEIFDKLNTFEAPSFKIIKTYNFCG